MTNLTPTANGEIVFLPLLNGKLIALGKSSGAFNWKSEIGGDLSAPPVADDSAVFIASEIGSQSKSNVPYQNGALHCLGSKSGITLWARSLSGPIRAALTITHNTLFAGSVDGKLYSLNKTTGEINWIKGNLSPFYSRPVPSVDKLYIGDEAGHIVAVEQASGSIVWRYRTRGALRASLAISGGFVYAGSTDSNVYALSERSGKLRWRARTGAAVQSLIVTSSCVIATSLDNFVYCLSPKSGHKIWKRQLGGRILSNPLATHDGVLIAPLSGDECVVLNLRDGKTINSVNVGEENNTAAAPIQAGSLLLITTRKGLLAFSGKSD